MTDAEQIAEMILRCELDRRGDLLYEVALQLQLSGQHFTAQVIEQAALTYGVKNDFYGKPV